MMSLYRILGLAAVVLIETSMLAGAYAGNTPGAFLAIWSVGVTGRVHPQNHCHRIGCRSRIDIKNRS